MEFALTEFDGPPPIDAYGDGGFRIAGHRVKGSMLVLPSGFYPWQAHAVNEVTVESFASFSESPPKIDLLLIGCGAQPAALKPEVRSFLRDLGISTDTLTTGAACRTYNVLLGEGRRIGAALVAI